MSLVVDEMRESVSTGATAAGDDGRADVENMERSRGGGEAQESKPTPSSSPGPAVDAVEKDRSSPSHSSASSPEPNCPICLGKMENKSFTNSCCHQFCFTCLLEWSKVKPQCPLCKQPFKSIVHSVRSMDDFDQYYLTAEDMQATASNRRFRYRTTMTSSDDPRSRRHRHIQGRYYIQRQLFFPRFSPRVRDSDLSTTIELDELPPPRFLSDYRRHIYEYGHWVQPVSRNEGVRRTDTAFYANNPAMTHRLVPWLNRELNALNCGSRVAFVIELILSLLERFPILSPEFSEHVRPYVGRYTRHFVHEFYHFARSPHDMAAYDRAATYPTTEPLPLPQSNTTGGDSDVEIVEVIGGGGGNSVRDNGRPPWSRYFQPIDSIVSRARDFLQTYNEDHNSPQVLPLIPAITLSPQPGPSGLSNYVQEIVCSSSDDEEVLRRRVKSEAPPASSTAAAAASTSSSHVGDEDDDDIIVLDPPPRQPPEIIILSDVETDTVQPQPGPSTSFTLKRRKVKKLSRSEAFRFFQSSDDESAAASSSSPHSPSPSTSKTPPPSEDSSSSDEATQRKQRKSRHSKKKRTTKSKTNCHEKTKKRKSGSETDDLDSKESGHKKRHKSHHHKHKSKKSKSDKL